MIKRLREALHQGHNAWKWRHDTDILLRLLEQAQEERIVLRKVWESTHGSWQEWEQVAPWQV